MYIRELHFREWVHQQRGLGGIGEEVSEPFTEYYYYYYLFFLFHSFHPCFFFQVKRASTDPPVGRAKEGRWTRSQTHVCQAFYLFYSILFVLFYSGCKKKKNTVNREIKEIKKIKKKTLKVWLLHSSGTASHKGEMILSFFFSSFFRFFYIYIFHLRELFCASVEHNCIQFVYQQRLQDIINFILFSFFFLWLFVVVVVVVEKNYVLIHHVAPRHLTLLPVKVLESSPSTNNL